MLLYAQASQCFPEIGWCCAEILARQTALYRVTDFIPSTEPAIIMGTSKNCLI
jgi:hypothetical protein